MPELPVYATEVKFYRDVLGIAYETGSRLRKLGVIKPDAVCDDDRPIFLLSPESIITRSRRVAAHSGTRPESSRCAQAEG